MIQPPFAAVIFDMDGVLVDSEPLFLRAVNDVLMAHGIKPLTMEENSEFIGKYVGYTWETLHQRFALPKTSGHFQRLYDLRLETVLSEGLELRSGAAALLGAIQESGMPRALATSSQGSWVSLKLRLLRLENYFSAVVAAEDVVASKPAPDVYLRAAALSGIDPLTAIAIEDSPAGIASAKAAGIYTIALRTPSTEGLDLVGADEIIDALDAFDTERLLGLNRLPAHVVR